VSKRKKRKLEDQRSVSSVVRVRAYAVLARAVEEGYAAGRRRAYKHSDTPGEAHVEDAVTGAILSSICEVFDFDE
jgi:hypothetical protein